MSSGMETPSDNKPGGSSSFGSMFRIFLLLCLVAVIVYVGNVVMQTLQAKANMKQTEETAVQGTGLVAPLPKKLADKYTDKDGRLMADAPAADQLIEPEVLVLAHIVGSDPETPTTNWAQFEAHLSKITGKKVVDREFTNSADDLTAISQNKITIVALHAADTPFLVNNYGFQPAAVLGDDSGTSGNKLDVIVPGSSSFSKLTDLKGHSLLCTVPTSITGYRAAVALLMRDQGLRPNADYYVTWSMGPKRSIETITKNQAEAAAVSDDKLQSMLAKGDIEKSQYKLLYQSEVIPRTTVGWFSNLKPELAEKVRQAILSFKPTGGAASNSDSDTEADSSNAKLHFIPVEYKKDFEMVRLIDDSFDPRLDAKAKGHQTAVATTMPSAS